MQKVTADRSWRLHDVAATRRIEQRAAAALPPHTLMQRAGLATARLALALAPHARQVWIACGPGNNGGDGLEAALLLRQWGKPVAVTIAGDPARFPADAAQAWRRCQAAGVPVLDEPPPGWDLCIDALLGIGAARPLQGAIAQAASCIAAGHGLVLAVDVPSGLAADTGQGDGVRAHHTLSLLTLKPGLFTARGRDAAGQVWFDDLQAGAPPDLACAELSGPPALGERLHASHKGSYGDVAIVGGAPGMAGAAVLAAAAALTAGAGRVFLCPLDERAGSLAPAWPDLMLRDWKSLPLQAVTVACGCGGGEAVGAALPAVLARSQRLVLDADGLNAVAADPALQQALRERAARGQATVLSPHPLEAARLLGSDTGRVQADRLRSARELAQRFDCTVVLKGSGSVVAAPGALPRINPTGNARLATAGTGDVLAGMLAAALASGTDAFEAACAAVYRHGRLADRWPADRPLTAGALALRANAP
ncbi:NAD(P)H-hydrate dehydratase [Ramlibacter tataouinensis]|uniref:NAD(P)H-hydrate dehydratase n=1 Tax=Ramlibacter tataouinensis TaxID=94132 RepID=UPI0022F3DCFC|nr:NAD(P)H-hydrate dehydratase [Ramlibacter tataouinensis]WBY02270.1 NAD(P)H-hydrate dehydratase [Ramlibacter tataouinensis]